MKVPKIGKRGWLGVILCVSGLLSFIGSSNLTKTEMQESNDSIDKRAYENAVAKEAGYNSFSDALDAQNRKSDHFVFLVGGVLVWWGYKRYNGKKAEVEKSQDDQSNTTAT